MFRPWNIAQHCLFLLLMIIIRTLWSEIVFSLRHSIPIPFTIYSPWFPLLTRKNICSTHSKFPLLTALGYITWYVKTIAPIYFSIFNLHYAQMLFSPPIPHITFVQPLNLNSLLSGKTHNEAVSPTTTYWVSNIWTTQTLVICSTWAPLELVRFLWHTTKLSNAGCKSE